MNKAKVNFNRNSYLQGTRVTKAHVGFQVGVMHHGVLLKKQELTSVGFIKAVKELQNSNKVYKEMTPKEVGKELTSVYKNKFGIDIAPMYNKLFV